jgi:hypothetical protein
VLGDYKNLLCRFQGERVFVRSFAVDIVSAPEIKITKHKQVLAGAMLEGVASEVLPAK